MTTTRELGLLNKLPMERGTKWLILEIEGVPVRLWFGESDGVFQLSVWQILVRYMKHYKVSFADDTIESLQFFPEEKNKLSLLRVKLSKPFCFLG